MGKVGYSMKPNSKNLLHLAVALGGLFLIGGSYWFFRPQEEYAIVAPERIDSARKYKLIGIELANQQMAISSLNGSIDEPFRSDSLKKIQSIKTELQGLMVEGVDDPSLLKDVRIADQLIDVLSVK